MWLRDILPETGGFENARIMTFGYNSRLRDRANLVDITGWADALLHAVNIQKRSPEVSLRGTKTKKTPSSRPSGKEATNYLCVPFHGWPCRQGGKHTPDP
jgi:hypothetical protein